MRRRYFSNLLLGVLVLNFAMSANVFGQIQGRIQADPSISQESQNRLHLQQNHWLKEGFAARGAGLHAQKIFSRQGAELRRLYARVYLLTRENSPLAQTMQRQGLLAEALHWYVFSDPGNPGERLGLERDLVRGMIRYLQTAKAVSPGDHQRNLRFFSGLVGALAQRSGVEIADLADRDHSQSFVVPAQFLQPGHRGLLGAILDLLQDSDYVVRPRVQRWFERPSWLRWFDSSV